MKNYIVLLFCSCFLTCHHAQTLYDLVDSAFTKWDEKKYPEALEYFQKALDNDAMKTDTLYTYGNIYYNMAYLKSIVGDYYGAIEGYSKVIENGHPQNVTSFFERGLVKLIISDSSGAIEDFVSTAKLNDLESNLYSTINFHQTSKSEFQSVIKSLNLALENGVKKSEYYFALGFYYNAQKKYRKALESFSRAIEIDSKNSIYYFRRGLTYKNWGKNSKSCKDFQQALSLGYIDKRKIIEKYCN